MQQRQGEVFFHQGDEYDPQDTITPFRNAEYLSAYYFIPKRILEQCGKELNSIPRNPQKLIRDYNAVAVVESDLFIQLMMDAYAYMVWPYMCPGEYMEVYSGYDPAWIFAHSPAYWVQEMLDENVIPPSSRLLRMNGDIEWVTEEEANDILQMVDEGKIALTPAVELSYLQDFEQEALFSIMDCDEVTPSLSQAQCLRRMSEDQTFTDRTAMQVLSEVKGNQKEYVKVPVDSLRSYFRPDTSIKQMTETLVKAMEFYNKHLERQRRDRDAR